MSCPYCPRTFTRNNTVRRHVAREHRHLGGRIPTKFGSTRVMPDPIRLAQSAAANQSLQNAVLNAGVAGTRAPAVELPHVGNSGPN